MQNWKHKPSEKLEYNTKMEVPAKYAALVRTVDRDFFLKEERVPTIDLVLENLKELSWDNVIQFNLFVDGNYPTPICHCGHGVEVRYITT